MFGDKKLTVVTGKAALLLRKAASDPLVRGSICELITRDHSVIFLISPKHSNHAASAARTLPLL